MRPSLVALLFAACSVPAFSQATLCFGSELIVLDTFNVQLVLSEGSARSATLPVLGDAGSTVVWEYVTLRPAPGEINYYIPVDSIHFSGTGSDSDSLSTGDLFDLLAQTTIANSYSLGHFTCGDSCPGTTVRVYQQSCVQRLGIGGSTHFAPCDTASCCSREYRICCPGPNAFPVLTFVGGSSATCASTNLPGCQSTCP